MAAGTRSVRPTVIHIDLENKVTVVELHKTLEDEHGVAHGVDRENVSVDHTKIDEKQRKALADFAATVSAQAGAKSLWLNAPGAPEADVEAMRLSLWKRLLAVLGIGQ